MSKYAVIESGSKQYRIEPNTIFSVEKLTPPQDKKPIILDQVLMVRDGEKIHVGTPFLNGAKVTCEYLENIRAPKVVSFKFRRRKNSRTKRGHRQQYSRLLVKDIQVGP